MIYEGATELEFYKRAIQEIISPKIKKLKLGKKSLKSSSGINKKVKEILVDKIDENLRDGTKACNLYFLIVHDRDGSIDKKSALNIDKIREDFLDKEKNKTYMIEEVVATKELESWFLYDMNGIYNYLGVSKRKRNLNHFGDPHNYKSSDLISFCRKHKKEYSKGHKSQELIECLDINYIYQQCEEFNTAFKKCIKKLK